MYSAIKIKTKSWKINDILYSLFLILIFFFCWKVKNALSPFILAFFLAFTLEETRDKISSKLKINSNISTALIVFITFFFILLIFLILIPLYLKKIIPIFGKINYDDLKNMIHVVNLKIDSIFGKEIAQILKNQASEYLSSHFSIKDAIDSTITKSINYISTSVSFLITPIATFLILKDTRKIKKTFYIMFVKKQNIISLVKLFQKTFKKVKEYFKVQFITSFSLSFLYIAPLLIFQIKNAFLIGILISLLSFIPYIGFYIGLSIASLLTFENYNNFPMILNVNLLLIFSQIIDSVFISPKLIGDKLKINPFWLMFGAITSIELFGIMGIFFGTVIVIIIDSFIRSFVSFILTSKK
jgi:putative permease